jgi:hypothetical protein
VDLLLPSVKLLNPQLRYPPNGNPQLAPRRKKTPSHSISEIRHPSIYYSTNCEWNSPSQASLRRITAPPRPTDRQRPPSHRASRSGTGWEDSSRACSFHVQCYYIKSEIAQLHTLLWHCARCLPLAHISRPQRILAAQTCPSPFALRSAYLNYAGLHPPPFIPSPLALDSRTLHSCPSYRPLHPSFRRSSPLSLPPFTPALH